MDLPSLVTTGTDGTTVGVLGRTNTRVVLGDEPLLTDARHGARLKFGAWISPDRLFAIQGDVIGFDKADETHIFSSLEGYDYLARPYINAQTGEETSETIAFPGAMGGLVGVRAQSRFGLAGLSLSRGLLEDVGNFSEDSWFLSAGFRHGLLNESLQTQSLAVSNSSGTVLAMELRDHFQVKNQFNGVELGTVRNWKRNRWSLKLGGSVALGSNRRRAIIDGDAQIGPSATYPVGTISDDIGLLATSTNSGTFRDTQISMQSQLEATIGFDLMDNLTLSIGYSLFYWSNVARPGDQIDRTLNPDGFPFAPGPITGDPRPEFHWNDSDFWAQGLNLGLEARW